MIKTGLGKLDEILGGGIKNGTITDIFGASSTGKSQLALQIMANSLLDGGIIFYQDTTGTFRPERLLELFKPKGLEPIFLDKITVARITNISEQIGNISKIKESNFSLVIVDNVTDLFSFEYPKEEQILEKTTQFAKYMKELSKVALDKQIPIVIVNMMRKIDENEQENLGSIVSLFTHIKIRLSKKSPKYEGEVYLSPLIKNQFWYNITKEGLVDLTEAI
jgi:DNA repair protein RAD51